MNKRNFVPVFAPAALIVILLLGMARLQDKDKNQNQEQPMEAEALCAKAETLIRERDQLGVQLDAVLADEDSPLEVRIRAAQLLGRLQYSPAIPTLIRYAHLYPLFVRELIPPPVGGALADYGDAAVPQIVEAVLEENRSLISGGVQSGRSLLTFYLALRSGGTMETARTYALGIAATRQDDAELVEKVDTFVRRLERYLSEKRRK
jgi:hypothetical protein